MNQSQQDGLGDGRGSTEKAGGLSAGALMAIVVMLYGCALAASVLLITRGFKSEGIIGLLLVLTLSPIGFVLARGKRDDNAARLAGRIEDLNRSIRMMADQSALSDDARRVLNRTNERELLRLAIEEDIATENWDAAMVLVKELADRFGYRADAEEFRNRIAQARAATLDKQVSDAMGYLDGLIIQRKWDAAYADAARILRLFPDSPRAYGLDARVRAAHASYKQDLERRFLVASQEGRNEEALTLLKELDASLSPTEAEPLRELARGVIGKARENLGAQFKLAVQDRRWTDAVRVGEQILGEFPNTRMAGEVRDVIDGIRQRATARV